MKTMIAAVAAVLFCTALADGQGISFSFGKHGKHKSVGVSVGIPLGHHGHVHSNSCQRLVPGHYEIVREQVFVPGPVRQVWVEPVYRTVYDCHGHPHQEVVAHGHWETIQEPGRYELQDRKIWVPDQVTTCCGY